MRIGIDFDDVIVDFTKALMEYHHEVYGKKVELDQIKTWDWSIYWGVDMPEAIKRADKFHEAHKVEEIMPMSRAINSIKKLQKSNELFIITSRPIRFKSRVGEWLKHHLGSDIEVINAGDFHKGQGANKAEICKEMKITVMIEDDGKTSSECASDGIKVLMFDKPWNQGVKHKNIIRVNDWVEAMKEIKRINK